MGCWCSYSNWNVATWFFSGMAVDLKFIMRSSFLRLLSFDALYIGWIGFLVVLGFFVVMWLGLHRENLVKEFQGSLETAVSSRRVR
ncbi:unnamed protein product [Arabidopsis thaliana]|uniref:Transmembrane protein n=1 Tax=Arabidopsis thaliana TaxID=3702 RepID=A0A654ESI2_ARATH|nr:unnamed protein product [Arabidopsis thaliana]